MSEHLPAIRYPRHPAHLDAYVEVLGPALAVRFLIAFGGCPMYFPDDPKGRSMAEALIGPARLQALGQRMPSRSIEIPVPRVWLILALKAEGKGIAEICRTLKTTSRNVKDVIRRDMLKARAA
ncbi:hypothetical protein [Tropicibacter naphthalenivorans]|uniref:Mor transcription activator family protein n=1 Tax=Tropicibacter naphthalenivorans TaxID=441103 RepID=A0A0P1GWP3_9RHOB|nr:hypothetical protein [Tropicibacter naphthalenivorans]CUH80717.1 hypothetical protein TRN7648_03109 [Tropicibacter naphthalenivorans]SMC89498.1 hypothetical protein SAMN04488093_10679 [Tropicibacter naphthalenivorans]